MAIALDKKAREALKRSRQEQAETAKVQKGPTAKAAAPATKARAAKAPAPAAQPKPIAKPASTEPQSVTEILDQADKSERRQLIRKAIAVRHASKSALDDLSDEQRQALQVFALQAIIDRGKTGGGNS